MIEDIKEKEGSNGEMKTYEFSFKANFPEDFPSLGLLASFFERIKSDLQRRGHSADTMIFRYAGFSPLDGSQSYMHNGRTSAKELRLEIVVSSGIDDTKKHINKIVKEETGKSGIEVHEIYVNLLNTPSVGVQGDGRSYAYPVELELRNEAGLIYNPEFIAQLSSRITNEVRGVNRVIYVTARR